MISSQFVEQYSTLTPPWGFGGLGEIVYLRTYSRKKDDGTQETWPETIQRVINGAIEIGTPYTQDDAEALFDHMFHLRCSVSGRWLWQAGTPNITRYGGTSAVNCLHGDTEIVTREGIRRIGNLAGESVELLTEKGWVEAPVNSFGVMPTQKITFRPAGRRGRGLHMKALRSNLRVEVVATPDHRWPLVGGTITDRLAVGDVVAAQVNEWADLDPEAFIHGFVFGDGSLNHVAKDGTKTYRVRLCGSKDQQWKDLFVAQDWRLSCTAPNGDPMLDRVDDRDLKALPVDPTPDYAAGFLAGWIAADGHDHQNGTIALASQHAEAEGWLRRHAAAAGWVLNGINANSVMETNYGKRKAPLYRFSLARGERAWVVESIEPLGEAEVFCPTVPEVEAFTLASGVYSMNCAFLNLDRIEAFETMMDLLMLGSGVGFSVERSIVHELPRVKKGVKVTHERTNDADIIVPDSRQGWSRLLHSVLKSYFYTGKSFSYSTILVREFGAPLKSFGGTASGPGILVDGISDICKVLDARVGKKIRSIDALDIANIIGRIVVAGSARRSAQIAIGDPDDILFLRAKNWASGTVPAYRSSSNNSIYADSFDEIIPEFWKGYDGSGEPYGLINRSLARVTGRLGEAADDRRVAGVNPCFAGDTMFLTADGWRRFDDMVGKDPVIHQDQRVTYDHNAGRWMIDAKGSARTVATQGFNVRITGYDRDVFTLRTECGREVFATGDHHFATPDGMRTLETLTPGDKILVALPDVHASDSEGLDHRFGFLAGIWAADGTVGNGCVRLDLWDWKAEVIEQVEATVADLLSEFPQSVKDAPVPASTSPKFRRAAAADSTVKWSLQSAALLRLFEANGISKDGEMGWLHDKSKDFKAGFLSGFFHGDGSVQRSNGSPSMRISQSDEGRLRTLMLIMQELGVLGRMYQRTEAGVKTFREGQRSYETLPSWELIVTGFEQCGRLAQVISFGSHHAERWAEFGVATRTTYSSKYWAKVQSVEYRSTEDVYCLTEETRRTLIANGLTSRRCGEIFLESPSLNDPSGAEVCNLATIYLPNVESQEQFNEISRLLYLVQKQIASLHYVHEGTTKIVQRNMRLGQSVAGLLQATPEQRDWLDPGYRALRVLDAEHSAKMGWPMSIKLTAIKPDGTAALLPGVTSGIHPAFSEFYIRRVRFGSNDPLVDLCRKRGYKVVPEIGIDGREDHTRWVVEFPARSPKGAVLAKEMSAVQQLEWVKWAQTAWADNAVSVTVYYRKDELPEIKEWLAANYDDSIKSVSFLLHSDHNFALAPLEEITAADYDRLVAKIDMSVAATGVDGDLFDDCATGSCPVR